MTSLHLCVCSVNRNYQLVLEVKSSSIKLCVGRQEAGEVFGWSDRNKKDIFLLRRTKYVLTHNGCVECN